jgi:hypothetical protein
MPEANIVLDPPTLAKEFGNWQEISTDPNIGLRDIHSLVHINVEADTQESLNWFLNLVKQWRCM